MTKVAIIGSGPCGLSMLRAFQQAEVKGKKYQKLHAMKNKIHGVVYGIIIGEPELINTVIQFIIACIDICGLMAQRNV